MFLTTSDSPNLRDASCPFGYTPLMIACEDLIGHPHQVDIVRLLLHFNADVNAKSLVNANSPVNTNSRVNANSPVKTNSRVNASTPLMIACKEWIHGKNEGQNKNLVNMLLENGADVNEMNDFGTILHQVKFSFVGMEFSFG